MSIRPARATDAAALQQIIQALMDDTTVTFASGSRTMAETEQMIADRPIVLVAERDGQVVGYATYAQFRTGNGYAHAAEHSIALSPRAQGAGLGRALMGALEDHARAQGVHVMVAGVSGENAAGQAFHAALGYVETGRMPEVGRKFGRWLDLVLMQKTL